MVGGASRVDGVGKGWFARGSPYWHKVSPGRILHCPASFQGVDSGQITAYRIISRVAFKVFNTSGVEIFPESDIFLTRDLDFNPANIQSFDYMVNEVVKNMRADIVVQMLRRMSSIKTIEKPTNVNAQGYSRTIKPSPSSPAPNNSNTAK